MENMELTQKVAYIKGLMEGMNFEPTSNEGKLIVALLDVVSDLAEQVNVMDEEVGDLFDEVDAISEDLSDVEDYLWEDGDDEEDEDEDMEMFEEGLYEITCPACGEVVCVDEEMLVAEDLACPNCQTKFEIDFHDDEDCCCGGGCHCEDEE